MPTTSGLRTPCSSLLSCRQAHLTKGSGSELLGHLLLQMEYGLGQIIDNMKEFGSADTCWVMLIVSFSLSLVSSSFSITFTVVANRCVGAGVIYIYSLTSIIHRIDSWSVHSPVLQTRFQWELTIVVLKHVYKLAHEYLLSANNRETCYMPPGIFGYSLIYY